MARKYSILLYIFLLGIVMHFAYSIHVNGTIPDIKIQCRAPVVGYHCTVKCYVRDFKHQISIFRPKGIPVGTCNSQAVCSSEDGYKIKQNSEKKAIYLDIPRLNTNHSGDWYCTYAGGATLKPAKLQVKELPKKRFPSRYLTPYEGEQISLHCDFDYCTGCYDIKWYKDGNEIRLNDTTYNMDSSYLIIPRITQKHKGNYMCSLTTSGINIRNGSNIIINSALKIAKESRSKHYLMAVEGASLTLDCDFVPGNHEAFWKYNGESLENGIKYVMTKNGQRLRIDNITEGDIGTYVCYRETQVQSPTFKIDSILSIPKRDCYNAIPSVGPNPSQPYDSDSGQGVLQIYSLWNMLVWPLVVVYKFGFLYIYLWIFDFPTFSTIAISLFREEENIRIHLQKWIVVLAPVLILIMTPNSIEAIEDLGVFSLAVLINVIIALVSCLVVKPVLKNHLTERSYQSQEQQGCLPEDH